MGLFEPHDRYRERDGKADLIAVGVLMGIARHARPRGPMETLDAAEVTLDGGVAGDFRGLVKPGSTRKRQVTIIAREDWVKATDELGVVLDWSVRRVNLMSDGIELPREAGALLQIGDVVLEVTGECDPCVRMDAIAPGLCAALTPDWRGGILTRVVSGGHIAIGDAIAVEEAA